MQDEFDPLTRAVLDSDIAALHRLVADGADINARDEFGDPFLFNALSTTSPYDEASTADGARYPFIASLIELGADPCRLADDGASILMGPIFSLDTAMVELLLARGVDPNHGCGEPFETIYDLACFDYYYEVWMKTGGEPRRPPTSEELSDEDAYVRYLEEEAVAAGRPLPEMLRLLRRHGALAAGEMARKLGGDGSERIEWRDGAWSLPAEATGIP